MPKMLGDRLIPGTRRIGAYLLYDTFTTNRAAGAIQGTPAEPGPGLRELVVDTNSKLTIASDNLTFTTGGAATGNPALWYTAMSRVGGRIIIGKLTVSAGILGIGWDNAQAGGLREAVRVGNIAGIWATGVALTVGAATLGVEYSVASILRGTGAFYFIKGGIYTNWTLLYTSTGSSESSDYPGIATSGTGVTAIVAFILMPSNLWLPTPVASDGFSVWGTSDGLGHAEGPSGIGGGGNGKVWTNQTGTFTASAGVANASALSGGLAIATLDCGKADVVISVKLTWLAGTGGLIVRYVDANNYVQLRHTGTNLQLVTVLLGVPVTILDSAATYSAGARILLVAEATKFRCFYNELAVGAEQTIVDASLQTSTIVGLRTSDTGNTFDDLLVYARGTGGEYSELDSF